MVRKSSRSYSPPRPLYLLAEAFVACMHYESARYPRGGGPLADAVWALYELEKSRWETN